MAGISGSESEGADSIVLSGGYEDDEDLGDEIVYAGHGGRAGKGRQTGSASTLNKGKPRANGRTYESEWTRMDIASWNNLGMWRDKLQARRLARNDLRPYLEDL